MVFYIITHGIDIYIAALLHALAEVLRLLKSICGPVWENYNSISQAEKKDAHEIVCSTVSIY